MTTVATASAPPNGRPSRPPPPSSTPRVSASAPSVAVEIVDDEPAFSPPRIMLSAVEGWGKTTFAALAPSPLIVMVGGETGYETLRSVGRVPKCKRASVSTWGEILSLVDSLIADPRGVQTFALDTIGGVERACHEFVCARDFGGDWGEKGFVGFQRGYDMAIAEWGNLLARLDKLRTRHNMSIALLSHTKVATVKNPDGPDYDQYQPDCHHKTWGATRKWCDAALFGKYRTIVDGAKGITKKGKGIGGQERVLYCAGADSRVAKNRYGMPAEIDIPDDIAATWSIVDSLIREGARNGIAD